MRQRYIDPKSGNDIAPPSDKPSYDSLNKGLHKKVGGVRGRHQTGKFTHYDGKVEKVMHEFKHGQLHSGSSKGPEVKSRKQAIAIAMSEARKAGEK